MYFFCQKPWLGPSHEWQLWLGPALEKAKAASGQAKAGAFGPSQARQITTWVVVSCYEYPPTLFLTTSSFFCTHITYSQQIYFGLPCWASATSGVAFQLPPHPLQKSFCTFEKFQLLKLAIYSRKEQKVIKKLAVSLMWTATTSQPHHNGIRTDRQCCTNNGLYCHLGQVMHILSENHSKKAIHVSLVLT